MSRKKNYTDISYYKEKNKKRRARNRETNVISFVFIGLFLCMMGYLIYFNVRLAPSVTDSNYNKRISREPAPTVRRGTIFTANGTPMAQTNLTEEGTEYRYYPFGSLFAHATGMTRGGGSGLEGGAEDILTNSTSKIEVEVPAADTKGVEYEGDNVYTTLDENLQQVTYDALGGRRGAAIAMDPKTGAVLTMVSTPSYDPNEQADKIAEWLSYSSEDSVLVNRATQGLYAPGSTFKTLTALEYVREHPGDYESYNYYCSGTVSIKNATTVSCSHGEKHGSENLKQAFARSCNCAFSTIGLELDIDKYRESVLAFGLNDKIKLEVETTSTQFKLTSGSAGSEIMETAFGQGNTMITPLQNMLIAASVANNGVMMQPYLIDHTTSSDGTVLSSTAPTALKTTMTPEEAKIMQGFMRSVVTEGTASGVLSGAKVHISGKTGTAQYSTSKSNSHAWFIGYAPSEDPQIAIAVILEKDYDNSFEAVTVAKKVMESYLAG